MSDVRNQKSETGTGKGVGMKNTIRTRSDVIGYFVAHHDCADGEPVCQRFCHRDNVRVGVDRVGRVGPHRSRPEKTALREKEKRRKGLVRSRSTCTEMGGEDAIILPGSRQR